MIDIDSLVRPNIAALSPYSTARDELSGAPEVFLDANESPYESPFNRYPDPHQKALKQRISALKGIPADNLFLGNGSDEAIDLVIRLFCEPGRDNLVAIAPSYGMYEVAAATNDIAVRKVLLDPEDFHLDTEALLAATDDRTRVLFLCSPNNPTGNAFPTAQLLGVAARFPGIVVVDEAYCDFSSVPSLISRVEEFPNLIVLQTLSKAWGMAGLRVGLAIACTRTIHYLSMIKYPYNLNVLGQRAALEALERPIDEHIAETVAERERLAATLAALPFIGKVYPSEANFLLVRVASGDDAGADALYAHLLQDGIIVRNRTHAPLCRGCLRITIGTPEENRRLEASLQRYAL